jgi:hypothetical protein
MIVLDDYRTKLAGLPAESFIGSILWFSITGMVERPDGRRTVVPVRVSHSQLEVWFDDLSLDTSFLPPKIKKVDAFRTASSAAKAEYPLGNDQYAELMVREVVSDAEHVVRHVMREVRDTRGQTLSYDHMATLKFFRGGRTSTDKRHSGDHWKYNVLHGLAKVDLEQTEQLIADLNTRYTDLCANLQSSAIRGMIRNYLSSLNAIIVKPSGGVYFVHNSRQPTVDALQTLITRIGQGCTFYQFPLIDTPDSRLMLTDAFQSEVEDDCRLLLKDIAEINERSKSTGGKVNVKKYADLNARYQEVVSRSEEYTRVLGLAQGRAASALELALDSVMEIAFRLDVKGAK